MSAMPAAAPTFDKYSVVMVKNSGVAAAMPITASDKAASEAPRLPCVNVVMPRPIAAMATLAAKCQRRSPCLSELRPIRIMPNTPIRLGNAEYRPICIRSATPQLLMSVGTQKIIV